MMSKLEAPYSILGKGNTMQEEFPTKKCKHFFTGFITALILTLICGTAFQLYLYTFNAVTISSGPMRHSWPTPPPHGEVARVARYVVHNAEWASVATISSAKPVKGYPFTNIISISDGPVIKSSGTPYAYITPLDLVAQDLLKDNHASLSMSEAQSDYCKIHNLDPENPLCARVILSGTMKKVENGTSEAEFARMALFSRHPEMEHWPASHGWLFVKLDIVHIYVLDYFGGFKEVDVEEYYKSHI